MNIIYRHLDIVCKNVSEEVKLYATDYTEYIDEIKIRTDIRDDKLNRGWIGDLTYSTKVAYSHETGTEIENVAQSIYTEVLLASITVCSMDEGIITWEYRFLKK